MYSFKAVGIDFAKLIFSIHGAGEYGKCKFTAIG